MIQTSTGLKTFELRPISELFAIVKNDLRQMDDEGLIDEGVLIKTVMYCNDKLGIGVREIKQACIPVEDYKAKLPLNFEKLYFVAAIKATNTMTVEGRNPFNNNFDRDVIYEADIARDDFGGTDNYMVTIKRNQKITVHNCQSFIGLDVFQGNSDLCHISCPNLRKPGKYTVRIEDGHLITPFRHGEIYIMYIANMTDEEGNILFPFHPRITPYYEWALVEKVIMNVIFNSDAGDTATKLKLAQTERVKAWVEAYDVTTEKGFGEYVAQQRKKELGWYHQYFRYLQ